MSNPAAPALIGALEAVKAFVSNIGADPAQWAFKVPGAVTILLGTISLQLPVLAQAEAGALQADINAKVDALIKQLQG